MVQPAAEIRARARVTQPVAEPEAEAFVSLPPVVGVVNVTQPAAQIQARGGLRVVGAIDQQQAAASISVELRRLLPEDASNDESAILLELLAA
jgi:hypothetical protein